MLVKYLDRNRQGISTLPVYMQHHHTIFMGDLNYRIDLRNGFNNKPPKIDFDRVLGENHKLKHVIKKHSGDSGSEEEQPLKVKRTWIEASLQRKNGGW